MMDLVAPATSATLATSPTSAVSQSQYAGHSAMETEFANLMAQTPPSHHEGQRIPAAAIDALHQQDMKIQDFASTMNALTMNATNMSPMEMSMASMRAMTQGSMTVASINVGASFIEGTKSSLQTLLKT